MGVITHDIHFVVYSITCDYCGAKREIDTEFILPRVKNRREALHSINWQYGRGGKVRCPNCKYKPNVLTKNKTQI